MIVETGTNNFNESLFEGMFEGCTSLTKPMKFQFANESIPMKKALFKNMYKDSGLTGNLIDYKMWSSDDSTAYESTFEGMFQNCTGITRVDPITKSVLGTNEFKNMFNGCSSLSALSLTNLTDESHVGSGYTDGMLTGCRGTTIYRPSGATYTLADLGVEEGSGCSFSTLV